MGEINFDTNDKLIILDLGVLSHDGSWTFFLPVVLDTGATSTILPADVLSDLGYDPGDPGIKRSRIVTGSGIEYAPCVNVAALIAGGESIEEIDVLCHDLPSEAGVDGLLGLSFLRP
jgi:predicted aspartyl protease